MVEHRFFGDLLQCLWRDGVRDIEILRAEVDQGGLDLVPEANGVMRHVQLKSGPRAAKPSQVRIKVALARKPSRCVVWIRVDPISMELGPYLWFGGAPGAPLPPLCDRIGKHIKGDRNGVEGTG